MKLHRRELLELTGANIALAACAPPATGEEVHRVSTRFGDIAYRAMGHGRAALFLHGFPLSSYQWRDVMAMVAHERSCIAPDFMGLGETEVTATQSLSPHDQAAMLYAFLEAVGAESIDIIANDSGGLVAQLFVALWPARVRSLLLTNCDSQHDCPPPALQPVIELARRGRYAREWLIPWVNDHTLARSVQGLGGMCFAQADHPDDAAIDRYLAPLVRNQERLARTDRFALALEHNALEGIERHLKEFQQPVRIVWGSADSIFSAASPDYLASVFPGSRGVMRMPTAKLFFPEEYPETIASEALELWRGAPGAG